MTSHPRILLVQPPIASHNCASLGLARVKASLTSEGYPCDIRYLDHELESHLGPATVQRLAFRRAYWLMELLYAAELFPDYLDRPRFLRRHRSLLALEPALKAYPDPLVLLASLRRFNESVLRDWQRRFPYDALGITCNFFLMPSLYFASAVKTLHPGVQVILGGMQCGGEVGDALIRTFPFLDWVVKGEGELTALKIASRLRRTVKEVPPGASHRDGSTVTCNPKAEEPVHLDALPYPDFDDFVASYTGRGFAEPIHLAMETSRGCWWSRCAFCGFNSLGKPYRRLSAGRVVENIEYLAARHGVLNYQFVDNIAPPRLGELAAAIAASPYDFHWMISLRANSPLSTLEQCAEAGATELFFGIESFCTSVLERMGKGTTLFDNLMALKEARRVGISTPYFLLTQFPGETQEEVEANRRVHGLIPHLNSLSLDSPFYIHYGCPTQQDPQRFGLRRVFPKRIYRWLLPEAYRFSPTYFWDGIPEAPRRTVIDNESHPPRDAARLDLVDRGPSSSFVVDDRWDARQVPVTDRERELLITCSEPRRRDDLRDLAEEMDRLMARGWLVEERGTVLSLAILRTGAADRAHRES